MSNSQARWDAYFMEMAHLVASKSKDDSMKVGCVITQGNTVTSTGYNGFPRGIDDDAVPARCERPEKYFWTEHAERNAVYNAALNGAKLCYSIAYSTAHPCVECARAFIQSGVMELYIPTKKNDPFFESGRWDDWEEQFTKAREILDAAGVIVHNVI
jgi:dCMP deaminase